jgi:hypothetical protein
MLPRVSKRMVEMTKNRPAIGTKSKDEVREDVRGDSDIDNEKRVKSYAESVRGTGSEWSLIDFYSKSKG